MKTIILIFSLSTCFFVQAQDTDPLQPCMEIKKACENGMQKLKGKGQVKDCMTKMTNGETVNGVKVAEQIVKACKEKHEK